MVNEQGWRGVMVPPPNPLAAIGGALRHAFRVERAQGLPARFDEGRIEVSAHWQRPLTG